MSGGLIPCANSENEINNDKPGFLNELVTSRFLEKGRFLKSYWALAGGFNPLEGGCLLVDCIALTLVFPSKDCHVLSYTCCHRPEISRASVLRFPERFFPLCVFVFPGLGFSVPCLFDFNSILLNCFPWSCNIVSLYELLWVKFAFCGVLRFHIAFDSQVVHWFRFSNFYIGSASNSSPTQISLGG